MTKRRSRAALVLLLALAASVAFAQSSEVPTISIENAFDSAYNLATSDLGSSWRLSLCIGLSQKTDAQFAYIIGDGTAKFPAYRLLGFDYLALPLGGISVYVGQQTVPPAAVTSVTGVGIFINLLERTLQGSLQTGLRLRVDYLAPVTDVGKGLLRIGLGAVIGI